MGRPDSQDEGDGVHAIRLSGSIGADDGCKVRVAEEEGMASAVGLEVCVCSVSANNCASGYLLYISSRTSFPMMAVELRDTYTANALW